MPDISALSTKFLGVLSAGRWPRSQSSVPTTLRVPQVPRIWEPGMPQTSIRNKIAMLPVNPAKSRNVRRPPASTSMGVANPQLEAEECRSQVPKASAPPQVAAGLPQVVAVNYPPPAHNRAVRRTGQSCSLPTTDVPGPYHP